MLQNIKILNMLRLKSSADTVVADWNSSYRNSYIAKTSVSSSVNITTNNFVKNLEKMFVLENLEFLQDFSPVA
jgi:hypothetical protein